MSGFHDFQRLPPELRSQIWKLAMDPREISFVTSERYHPESRSPMAPRALVAPLLHACWESRMLMKKLYKKVVFGSMALNRCYVWVNYDLDTVFLDYFKIHHLPHLNPDWIRRLALHRRQCPPFPGWFQHYMGECLSFIGRLPNLTDVLLNFEASCERSHLRSPPWHPIEYTVMVECYATCRPAHFNLRIIDVSSDPDAVLSRDNFLCLLQELTPSAMPDYASQGYRLFEDPTAFSSNLYGKKSPIWKHVGCDCDQDMNDYQRLWEWRPIPDTTT